MDGYYFMYIKIKFLTNVGDVINILLKVLYN